MISQCVSQRDQASSLKVALIPQMRVKHFCLWLQCVIYRACKSVVHREEAVALMCLVRLSRTKACSLCSDIYQLSCQLPTPPLNRELHHMGGMADFVGPHVQYPNDTNSKLQINQQHAIPQRVCTGSPDINFFLLSGSSKSTQSINNHLFHIVVDI